MPTASALRHEIEQKLATSFPTALTPSSRTIRESATVGIQEIDELLDGGLPIGAITEITGPASSGRTCLALSFVAERTKAGQVCAWVDVGNALDPESAAASGVNLRRLLWVRCKSIAVQAKGKPWSRMDQALRATDLLLQSGGFAAIVLDMGDLATDHGRRIPLATWYRFKQAAGQSRTSLLLLGRASYAQSSAAVVLECSPLKPDAANQMVMDGCSFGVSLKREKLATHLGMMRKPPASTWTAKSSWATGTKA